MDPVLDNSGVIEMDPVLDNSVNTFRKCGRRDSRAQACGLHFSSTSALNSSQVEHRYLFPTHLDVDEYVGLVTVP